MTLQLKPSPRPVVSDGDQSTTAGAARRSTTFCAFDHDLRREGHPPGAQLTARPDNIARSRTTRGGSARRSAPRTCPAKRTSTGGWEVPRKKRARSARNSSASQGPHPRRDRRSGARVVPDARVRRSLRHARPAQHRVIGGPRFYERAEIRDAMAYLRVIHSPRLERIVNTPKRGLGESTIQLCTSSPARSRPRAETRPCAIVATDELTPKPVTRCTPSR